MQVVGWGRHPGPNLQMMAELEVREENRMSWKIRCQIRRFEGYTSLMTLTGRDNRRLSRLKA